MNLKEVHNILQGLKGRNNHAHVLSFLEYLKSPVHYTTDKEVVSALVEKGKGTSLSHFELPFNSLSVDLNCLFNVHPDSGTIYSTSWAVGNGDSIPIILETIYIGVLKDISVPSLSEFQTHLLQDLQNKFQWLSQQTEISIDLVQSTLSLLSMGVNNFNETMEEFAKFFLEHGELGDLTLSLKELLGDKQGEWINQWISSQSTHAVKTNAVTFYCTFRSIKGKTGYIYDWICDREIDGLRYSPSGRYDKYSGHTINRQYFEDGFNDTIHDFVWNFTKGFTRSWHNRLVVEKHCKPTKKQKRIMKKSGKQIRLRQLQFDTLTNDFVTSKTISENTSNEDSLNKMAGHIRSATNAFVWIKDTNVDPSDRVYARRLSKWGTLLAKVLRPRKQAVVNGGSITMGHIKAS